MVSPLWNAASEGNLDILLALFPNASPADIEIKDQNGVTPLQEAVKNGHLDVVRALLDKGADPSAISRGSPDLYTTNPEIIELLKNVSVKTLPPQDHPYPHDPNADPSKRYYPIPIPPYGYYPPLPPVPSLPDGSPAYYQPPPMPLGENGAFGNLPPPDIARFIPCRYYPACRYGSSCIFAHPQGPYYPGLPAPAQFSAPYDPMAHGYYPPPPSFHPPAPVPPHMNPVSPLPQPPVHTPHPPIVHTRSASDALSPIQTPVQAPFGSMSPATPSYPQPTHTPHPLSIPTLPPPHQPATAPGPQSPQSMYSNGPVSAPPFAVRQDPSPYPPPGPHTNSPYLEVNGGPKSPVVSQGENFAPPPTFRQGVNHNRRGSMRRGSFGGNRKPACLFYPAGRCRNGDECRFPHVIPDTSAQSQLGSRGSRTRDGANDISTIEENLATMAVRDDVQPRRGTNGTTNSSRSQSTDPGNRSKTFKSNGPRVEKKPFVKQRVPNADEFPMLGGSTSTSSRSSVSGAPATNGVAGPTAAQVLQAPPPRKDNFRDSGTRSASPEERQVKNQIDDKPTEINAAPTGNIATKLPISFAAAATGTPEPAKEVSVSA